jgi:hypothetical protein
MRIFLGFFLFALLSACATSRPQLADSDLCTGRAPASAVLCSGAYGSGAKQVATPKVRTEFRSQVDASRIKKLQSSNIPISDILKILAPKKSVFPVEPMIEFIQLVHPEIPRAEVAAHVNAWAAKSYWRKAADWLLSSKNVNEMSLADLYARVQSAPDQARPVLIEAHLRMAVPRWDPAAAPAAHRELLFELLVKSYFVQVLNSSKTHKERQDVEASYQQLWLQFHASQNGLARSKRIYTFENIETAQRARALEDLLLQESSHDNVKVFLLEQLSADHLKLQDLLSSVEWKKIAVSEKPDLVVELVTQFIEARKSEKDLIVLDEWLAALLKENKYLFVWKVLGSTHSVRAALPSKAQRFDLWQAVFERANPIEKKALLNYFSEFPQLTQNIVTAKSQSDPEFLIDYLMEPMKSDIAKENRKKAFESIYPTLSETGRTLELRAKIISIYPEFRQNEVDQYILQLYSKGIEEIQHLEKMVDTSQPFIEAGIKRLLESVLKANAPPAIFSKSPRPWAAFMNSLPARFRHEMTTKLLQPLTTSNAIADRIASLDPVPGVREAIIQFLSKSTFITTDNEFSHEQIAKMMGGDRFHQFFPHMLGVDLSQAHRTILSIAVYTSVDVLPQSALNPAWLRQKFDDQNRRTGALLAMSYRPALTHARLVNQLQSNFDFNQDKKQIVGLIVQGHYEKAGSSLMYALNRERGQEQVETLAPEVNAAIEANLQTGVLSKSNLLLQRLFTRAWSLDTDAGIDAIRNRAIWIAERENSFYDLRVEIHNFPNGGTLRKVKDYNAKTPLTKTVREQVEIIIRELESFLGVNSGGSLNTALERRMVLRDEHVSKLKALADQLPADLEARIKSLASFRVEARDLVSNYPQPKRIGHLNDVFLSEVVAVETSRLVDQLGQLPLARRVNAVKDIFSHLALDGVLSPHQIKSFWRALDQIDKLSVSELEKKVLMNQVLKGVLDQIFFEVTDTFGVADQTTFTAVRRQSSSIRFTDNFMRNGITFVLSKMVDVQSREIAQELKLEHRVFESQVQSYVEVYSPGEAVGVLRINPNALSLAKNDIPVFQQMPGESAPASGFVTVGSGARLSHLQLLAKSLKIPNVQIQQDVFDQLKAYDGQWVRLRALENGQLQIEKASSQNSSTDLPSLARVKIPQPNHSLRTPVTFADFTPPTEGHFAGPKGVTLARIFQEQSIRSHVVDGFILPFGFFKAYAERTGLDQLLNVLAKVDLKNQYLVGILTAQIEAKITANPIPAELLQQIKQAVDALEQRTGNKLGYFFRSDTNVEDLPNFNGAGLNESAANVKNDLAAIDAAVRRVWISPYSEKSIYWRGEALGQPRVTIAEPSVVVMPTVHAKSSGVYISRGGENWEVGRGTTSANFGIGSVVEAGRPVEEISFRYGEPLFLNLTVSTESPVPGKTGGLVRQQVPRGTAVLDENQAKTLNELGRKIDSLLGDEAHGWDIEWAFDTKGDLYILQARPNM